MAGRPYRNVAGTGKRPSLVPLFEQESLRKFRREEGSGFNSVALAIMIVCGAGNSAVADSAPTLLAPSGSLLPPDRLARWHPGLMSAGGIPKRTTIYKGAVWP